MIKFKNMPKYKEMNPHQANQIQIAEAEQSLRLP
jgi:hypothetical protein